VATTSTHGFHYLLPGDAPDIAGATYDLATDLEAYAVTTDAAIAGLSGGGSGISGVEGAYRASANQTIPNATDTVIAFGTTETASAAVTRATSGSGHKFTLADAGTYGITAVVRFAAGTAGSRFIELRDSAQTTGYVASGNDGGPAAATRNFSIVKRFAAATELVVIAAQSSGGALNTDYQGTSPTVYRVKLTITKITD